MRNIDFQTVHTQTPAVERSYQTRQAQVDIEQRQAMTVQQQAGDQKMQEAQQNPQSEGPQLHVAKKEEEQAKRNRKKKKAQTSSQNSNVVQAQTIISNISNHIDIRI